jgi:hypothetical protein
MKGSPRVYTSETDLSSGDKKAKEFLPTCRRYS